MNDLDIRRRLLADPARLSAADRDAVAGDKALREFHDELLALDRGIGDALAAIPVPEGLPERILLGARRRDGRRTWLALAAAVAGLAFAVALQVDLRGPAPELAMMEHVETSFGELRDDRGVSAEALRTSLAAYGVQLGDLPYRVRHLGHCVIKGREGRHFTLDGPQGVVSIVMLPDDGRPVPRVLRQGDLNGVFARRGSVLVGAFGTADAAALERVLNGVVA